MVRFGGIEGLFYPNRTKRRHNRRNDATLRTVERLEDRSLLSAVSCISASDGDWNAPTKWNTEVVPGIADDMTIDPLGAQTTTIAAGTQAVNSVSISSGDVLQLTGGAWTIASDSTVSNLDMSGCQLTSYRTLLFTRSSILANGGSRLFETFRNEEAFSVTSGDPKLNGATFNNAGTIINSGANLDFERSATLNNLSDGVFESTSRTTLKNFAGALLEDKHNGNAQFVNSAVGVNNFLHNAGTLRRSGTDDGGIGNLAIQNDASALIDVTAGSLALNGTEMMSRINFAVATNSVLSFSSSRFMLTGNYPETGTGHVMEPRLLLTSDSGIALGPDSSSVYEIETVDAAGTVHEVVPVSSIDRVTFPIATRVGELAVPIEVIVSAISPTVSLQVWIDWNGDGNWGGAKEQVAANVSVHEGVNKLQVDVPAWARSGIAIARFRLSSAVQSTIDWELFNDDIVDYQWTLHPPIYPSGLFGPANPIRTNAMDAYTIDATDLDQDGDLDMLAATSGDNTIAWYENDGNQVFTRHIITSSANEASWVTPVDLNGDGYLDVVFSSAGNNSISWYENDGHQKFTFHPLAASELDTVGFAVADVDGDGDLDVISSSKASDSVSWYENNGNQGFTKHIITTTADLACSVCATDIDRDGDLDIVSASFWDDTIAWYENDGRQAFTKRIITTTADGARTVVAADIDADGYQDVVSASYYDNTIAWYHNDGRGSFTKHVISSTSINAVTVFVADLDGDGDLDVLATSRGDNTISWFENIGGFSFLQHKISTTDIGAHGVIAADVNGDGRLDVISASQDGNRLAWYENLPNPTPFTVALDSVTPVVTNVVPIKVLVQFNAPAIGLTADKLAVENGILQNFSGSGSSYSFDLIPAAEGRVTATLAAGLVTNFAGIGNSATVFTREFDLGPPVLVLHGGPVEYVRNSPPIQVASAVTVTESRPGGGTLVVVISLVKTGKTQFDTFDDSALSALGTRTRAIVSGKWVTTVVLNGATTAEEIQKALRTITFSTFKRGLNFKTRELRIQLSDAAGQKGPGLSQTITVRRAVNRNVQEATGRSGSPLKMS